MSAVHPIEVESYRILGQRVDLTHLPAGPAAVVARVVHATADLDFVSSMVVDESAVAAGVAAVAVGLGQKVLHVPAEHAASPALAR